MEVGNPLELPPVVLGGLSKILQKLPTPLTENAKKHSEKKAGQGESRSP